MPRFVLHYSKNLLNKGSLPYLRPENILDNLLLAVHRHKGDQNVDIKCLLELSIRAAIDDLEPPVAQRLVDEGLGAAQGWKKPKVYEKRCL